MLSNALIAPIAFAVMVLAVIAPASALLFVDFATVLLPGEWDVSGILIGPSDLVMAALLTSVVLKVRNVGELPRRTMALWSLLVVLLALSYVSAPIHREWFEGPVQVVYQLLRYVVKPMLYLPLVLLLFRDKRRLDRLVVVFVLIGAFAALQINIDGYAGFSARGPFIGKNLAGGAMVLPFLLSLYQIVKSRSLFGTAFYGGCLLLTARAMLFVGSRGAFVSLFFALVLLALPLLKAQNYRYRVLRLAPLGFMVVVVVLIAKPDLMQRNSVRAVMSVSQGVEEDNMQWRMRQRWPHFWNMALEHPWLGIGTHVDGSLGDRANTPHSGYLAGFVEFGFPVTLLLFGLGFVAVWRCRRLSKTLEDEENRLLATFVGTCLMAIFVHLIVEATVFQSDYMMNCYLMLIGMSLALASPELAASPSEKPARRLSRKSRSKLRERPMVDASPQAS